MFQMTFILIAYFDWLLGPQKGQIFEKNFLKIFFSETVCFMKLILCIHAPALASTKKKNVFCSSQIRTLVAMATFSFHSFFAEAYARNMYAKYLKRSALLNKHFSKNKIQISPMRLQK